LPDGRSKAERNGPGGNPINITILHTNDMHGREQAMARLSHLARRLRAEAEARGEFAFLWDAGDPLDRRFPLCSMTKGSALAPVLNAMGYSLMTMGNDILLTYGPEAMASLARRLNFPVLAANCRDGDGPLSPGLQESVLLPLTESAAMGVFGLTAPWGGLYETFGLRFPDARETARRLVDSLRQGGASLVVALSHLGLQDDKKLVEAVDGIDLVIGAHTHDLLENGVEHAGVLIAQAGQYAEALGIVEIELDPSTGRPRRARATVQRVSPDEPPDPPVLAALAEAEAEVESLAARRVAQAVGPLDLTYDGESPMGNLAADAFRERMKADVAVIISGQLVTGLPSGPITFGDVNRASVITANPQRTRVHGAEILAALERGTSPGLVSARPTGLRGQPVGWPQISGMAVEWDPQAPDGHRIRRAWVGEELLDPDRTYLMAHSDAETMRDFALFLLDEGRATETEIPTVTSEVLEDYLRRHSPVTVPPGGRWRRVSS
jgi:2',3'-cyclic-nucleotide 2'-phosphodiesterase (5'-nucleotidase family)